MAGRPLPRFSGQPIPEMVVLGDLTQRMHEVSRDLHYAENDVRREENHLREAQEELRQAQQRVTRVQPDLESAKRRVAELKRQQTAIAQEARRRGALRTVAEGIRSGRESYNYDNR